MLDSRSRTEITYAEQFADSAADPVLQPGFLEYHKQEFCKYFQLTPEEFQGKSVLDTGSGPGKHAAVLHAMGAHVTAVDLLETNVRAIERLKAHNNFRNMTVYRADLTQPLPEQWPQVEMISAHNWIQHSENPARGLENLVNKLQIGGRLYLSTYQAGIFCYFIAQIARRVLRWPDRELIKSFIPFFFPVGFLEFGNPGTISYANMFDDFFVPYMWTFRAESLNRYFASLGCKILTPHVAHPRLYAIDIQHLKMSVIKVSPSTSAVPLEHDIDAFELSHIDDIRAKALIADSVEWARRAIRKLEETDDQEAALRAHFCLGLYRLRGVFSLSEGVDERHAALQRYLKRFVTGDSRADRETEALTAYYSRIRTHLGRKL